MGTKKVNMRLLNSIIYKLYQITDDAEMCDAVLKFLTMLVPYDRALFYLAFEPGDKPLEKTVTYNISDDILNIYETRFKDENYLNWMFSEPKSQVFRETDFFEEEIREQTNYYKNIYRACNVHYSLSISLYYSKVFLGELTLFRAKEKHDFSDDEVFLLQMLKDHLALRLFYSLQNRRKQKDFSELYGVKDLYLGENEYNLTAREKQILEMVLKGMNNKEISDKLFISPHTTKKHLMNIYKKVGINSKWELIKKAPIF